MEIAANLIHLMSTMKNGCWFRLLILLLEEAGQRDPLLREVFSSLRDILKTGAPWRWIPNDLPP